MKEENFQVKKFINKNKTDLLLVTSPENIAWILNIRGQVTTLQSQILDF